MDFVNLLGGISSLKSSYFGFTFFSFKLFCYSFLSEKILEIGVVL